MFSTMNCNSHFSHVKLIALLILIFILQSCAVIDNTTIAIDKKIFERQERNAGNYEPPPVGLKPITVFVNSASSPNVDKEMIDWAVDSLESYASRSKRFRVINKAGRRETDAELIVKIDKLTKRDENTKESIASGTNNDNKVGVSSKLTEESQMYSAVSVTLLQRDEKVIFQGEARLSSYRAVNLFDVVLQPGRNSGTNIDNSLERADEVDRRRVIKVAVDRSVRKLIDFIDNNFITGEL
jgi:hypothetical protein